MQNPKYCEGCKGGDTQLCPLHGEVSVVGDAPVLSHARLSLPSLLTLRETAESEGKGRPGVFAAAPIQARTRFGPLIAPPHRTGSRTPSSVEHLPDYDLTDEDRCNWMALVRPAQCQADQNLDSMVLLNKVYFVSTQLIPKDTELRVWYAPWYAQKCGRHLLPQTLGELQQNTIPLAEESCIVDTAEDSSTSRIDEASDLTLSKRSKRPAALPPQSSSETSSRKRRTQIRNEKKSEMAVSDDSVRKTLSPSPGAVELKSRSGRKLKPNSKYPISETDNSDAIYTLVPKKQRRKSSAEPGKLYKLSPPAPLNNTASTPMKTSLDVLISAIEKNQDDVQGRNEESANDSGEVGAREPDAGLEPPKVTTSRGSYRYSCSYCKVNFTAEEPWRKHEAQHTGKAPFVCEVEGCGKGFDTKFKFWRHQMTHRTPTNKKCPYCSKCFHRADHLKKHVQTHDAFRQLFTCERCGIEYKSKESHTYHMAVHRAQEDESLLCSLCPSLAASKEELIGHLKTVHNRYKSIVHAPKRHSCPTCGKGFTTKKDMQRHTLVHEKKRNFLCEHCSQAFVRKDHLQRHMHSNHKSEMIGSGGQESRLVCDLCHCGFHSEDQLAFHVSSAHSQAAALVEKSPAMQDSSTPQSLSTQEVLVVGLKEGGGPPQLGDQDWTGVAGPGGQTVSLSQAPSSWSSMLPSSAPLSAAVCLVVQSQAGSGSIPVQGQQQITLHHGLSGPKQVLVQLQQVQPQAVPHHQPLQHLPVQHGVEQEQQQQQYLLQLHLQKSHQQQSPGGLEQHQEQPRPPPPQQVSLCNLASSSSECSCMSQENQAFQPVHSSQPENTSAAGGFQNEFTATSQSSENGAHNDTAFGMKLYSNHGPTGAVQGKNDLTPANQTVPRVQQQLINVPRAITAPVRNSCCDTREVSCANMELPLKKGVCMLTTLGFHTTQLKEEVCDHCPVMGAVSLAGGCCTAGGSCCSLDSENPPMASAPSVKSCSGAQEFLSNPATLSTTAQNPPTNTGSTSAGSVPHNGRAEGESTSLSEGEWTALPTSVCFSSAQNQTMPTFNQEVPVSKGMSSKLFPQAFPARGHRDLPQNPLVPDLLTSTSSELKGSTVDTLSSDMCCGGGCQFAVSCTDKPGSDSLSGTAVCLPASDQALKDASVVIHTSAPSVMISTSSNSGAAHMHSSPLQAGEDNCAEVGSVESSLVQPTETPAQGLVVPGGCVPELHGPVALGPRQPLWEQGGSQGSSDHCYATVDGMRQSADSAMC